MIPEIGNFVRVKRGFSRAGESAIVLRIDDEYSSCLLKFEDGAENFYWFRAIKPMQKEAANENVIPFGKFGVYEFFWGAGVKDELRDKWVKVILRGSDAIDLEDTRVELHENGIEFLR